MLSWLAVATKPDSGLRREGSSEAGTVPDHSNFPPPGTGSSPGQFFLIGTRPVVCQPISPFWSAQSIFREGVRFLKQASRNSGQFLAWSIRRLAKYGAHPHSS